MNAAPFHDDFNDGDYSGWSVGAVVIMNVPLISVVERTKEIARSAHTVL